MNIRNALAGVASAALLMCSAAYATPEALDITPHEPHAAVPGEMPEAMGSQGFVLIEIPGEQPGTAEIVMVPVELLAMLIMQAEMEAEAQREQQPIAAPPSRSIGVEI